MGEKNDEYPYRLSSCLYLLKISNRNCSTAVDFVSRLPEAVFFRWPLVKENGAMKKYCKFDDK